MLQGLSLKKPEDIKEFDKAFAQLKSEYPGHLPLLTMALKKYDGLEGEQLSAKTDEILSLCEEIVLSVDKVELACTIARKCPDESKGLHPC